MGKYGGTTTVMNTLDVGTKFFVHNGNWSGEIIEVDGVKHLATGSGNHFPLDDSYDLDITIETSSKFKFHAHMGCACSSADKVFEVPDKELDWYGDDEDAILRHIEKKYYRPWLEGYLYTHIERVL